MNKEDLIKMIQNSPGCADMAYLASQTSEPSPCSDFDNNMPIGEDNLTKPLLTGEISLQRDKKPAVTKQYLKKLNFAPATRYN